MNMQKNGGNKMLKMFYPFACVESVFSIDYKKLYNELGCAAVEMESFALFNNANVLGKKAACVLTISDSFCKDAITSSEERQTSFNQMMLIALELAE